MCKLQGALIRRRAAIVLSQFTEVSHARRNAGAHRLCVHHQLQQHLSTVQALAACVALCCELLQQTNTMLSAWRAASSIARSVALAQQGILGTIAQDVLCQGRQYSVGGISQTSPTKLSEVMKLEELQGKTPEEISAIWLEYHSSSAGSSRAGSVMSKDDWELLQERAKKSPMFVLPIAKPGGFVTMLTQQQLPFTLVTSLEEYRRFGPGAPASIMVTHYTELVDSAKLVLVRADVVNDKMINTAEARTVMELLRAFYTDGDDYKMVLDFNHNPTAFDFNKLLDKLAIKTDTSGKGKEQ